MILGLYTPTLYYTFLYSYTPTLSYTLSLMVDGYFLDVINSAELPEEDNEIILGQVAVLVSNVSSCYTNI